MSTMPAESKNQLKLVVLGDSGPAYKGTVGAEFLTKELEVEEGKVVQFRIWDTAGQERFRSIGAAFYRDSQCCVLVFDVNVASSFQNLDDWKETFLSQANPDDPANFPFVVVGNKIDLGTRVISTEQAQEWCKENGNIPYFEISAKDGTNVDLPFKEMARRVLLGEKGAFSEVNTTVKITNNPGNSSKKGCPC